MAEPEPPRVQSPSPPPPPLPQPPEPAPAPDATPAPPEPEAPPPETEAPVSEKETDGQLAPDAAPEAAAAEPAEEDSLTDEELEEMLGAETDFEPMESIVPEDSAEIQPTEVEDFEDIPEPEPIPRSLTADTDDDETERPPKRRGNPFIIAGASALSVVIVLVATAYFARGTIISTWPSAGAWYAMIGLGESLGAGLLIAEDGADRLTEGGVDVLVVRGTINNVSDRVRDIPLIRLALLDSVEEEVMAMVIPPPRTEIRPGGIVRFSARIEDPPGTARRVLINFTEAEAPAADAGQEAPATESGDKPAS